MMLISLQIRKLILNPTIRRLNLQGTHHIHIITDGKVAKRGESVAAIGACRLRGKERERGKVKFVRWVEEEASKVHSHTEPAEGREIGRAHV